MPPTLTRTTTAFHRHHNPHWNLVFFESTLLHSIQDASRLQGGQVPSSPHLHRPIGLSRHSALSALADSCTQTNKVVFPTELNGGSLAATARIEHLTCSVGQRLGRRTRRRRKRGEKILTNLKKKKAIDVSPCSFR